MMALAFAASPLAALAAEATNVEVSLVGEAVVDESARLVIEVTDDRGRPSVSDAPEVSFSPEEAVTDVTLYDCGDSSVFANCRPNNRAVDGVYEVHFMVAALPATATVNVGDIGQSLSLESGAVETVKAEVTPEMEEKSLDTQVKPAIKPEDVKVGPGQLTWVVLLPLFLMCSVVSYFVLTTE